MNNFHYVLLLTFLVLSCMCQNEPIGNTQVAGQVNKQVSISTNNPGDQIPQRINSQNTNIEVNNQNTNSNTPKMQKLNNQQTQSQINNQNPSVRASQKIDDQAIKQAQQLNRLQQEANKIQQQANRIKQQKQKEMLEKQKQQQLRLQKQQRQRYAQMRRKQQQQLEESYNTQGMTDITQRTRLEQLRGTSQILNSGLLSQSKEFTFQVIKNEQFVLKVPIDQQFVMIASSYVLDGEHYRLVKNLNVEGRCKIVISNQGRAPILERDFYFQTGIKIALQKDQKYILRFQNIGNAIKLVTMKMKYVAEHTSLDDKLLLQDNNYFSNLVVTINHQFDKVLGQLAEQWMLDHSRAKDVNLMTKSYFSYQIFEIIFTVIAALIQLRLLSKLLKGGSLNII